MQNQVSDADAALVMQFLQNPEAQALRRLLLQTGGASQPASPATSHAASSGAPPSNSSAQPTLNPIASHYQSARAQFASMIPTGPIPPSTPTPTPTPTSFSGLPSFLSSNSDDRNFNGLRTTYNLTLDTSSANERRRQAAEVNLPRNRQSSGSNPGHRVRPRGRASAPPALPVEPKGIARCINPANGNLRVSILVHPPAVSRTSDSMTTFSFNTACPQLPLHLFCQLPRHVCQSV